MNRPVFLCVVGVVCAVILGCDSDASRPMVCSGEGRELWECRGPADYDLTVTRDCFCYAGGQPVLVEVRNHQAMRARFVETGEAIPKDEGNLWTTVEDLFAMTAPDHGDGYALHVTYDPDLGYPSSITLSCPPDLADCGIHIAADVKPRRSWLPLQKGPHLGL